MMLVLTVVAVISTLYAIGLNLSYVLLWPFARMGITARMRQRGWAWYEEAFASPMTPGISIVVPAHNEQAVVLESIQSILAQRYPRFELVLVDDGSSDDTATTVIAAHDLRRIEPTPRGRLTSQTVIEQWRSVSVPEVTLVRKHNGGRADALNCGIDVARYPLVCVTDADSILDPSALAVMVRPFLEDPERVVAVGGTVRVGNSSRVEDGRMLEPRVPRTLVAGFQMIEYLRAFLLGRTGWDRLGALMIVSGAFGLFRRDVLEQVGGYWTETVGEDLEMTLRLHRSMRDSNRAHRVVYSSDPVCWTEVPSDVGTLGHQRRRWHRGLWESLWRHRGMLLRPRYGVVGMVGLPYMLVFEFLGPVFVVAAWIAFPIGLALGVIDPWIVFLWVIGQAVFGTLVTLASCALEERAYRYYRDGRDLLRMMALAVLENLCFRQLVDAYRLVGMWDIIRRKRGWGKMHRRGLAGS
jgi:cellulose synthase/poly-beta-1,6-N-acetylglucosamine synthase-like glycosyltransferase